MSEQLQKNYYEILGLTREASHEEIRRAYKELALVYHPDSNFFDEIIDTPLSPHQMRMFQQITSAYSTLNNPKKRALYDRTLPPIIPKWENPSDQISAEDQLSRLSKKLKKTGMFGDPVPEVEIIEIEQSRIDLLFNWFGKIFRRHIANSKPP